jgi:anti-anti-sigma regulatory factor
MDEDTEISIQRINNRIKFGPRISSRQAPEFVRIVGYARKKFFYQYFVLDFSEAENVYPNGIIPIIVEVDRLKSEGINFDFLFPCSKRVLEVFQQSNYLHFFQPEKYALNDLRTSNQLSLHKFTNNEEWDNLIQSILDIAIQQLVFAPGVAESFEWIINELAGNTLVHADSDYGFVQVVTYPNNDRIALVIADNGIGILGSMRKRFPEIQNDLDAINKAIQKGVTSNPEFGQGNGLTGTISIVANNSSTLNISSGTGSLYLSPDGKMKPAERKYYERHRGTLIDLQLNTNQEINLQTALWGHDPVSFFEIVYEKIEGEVVILVREHSKSFGNRIIGQNLRNKLLNICQGNKFIKLIIDFDGVSMVSSSFADEFIAKFAKEIGILIFMRRVEIKNANALVLGLIEKALRERIGA